MNSVCRTIVDDGADLGNETETPQRQRVGLVDLWPEKFICLEMVRIFPGSAFHVAAQKHYRSQPVGQLSDRVAADVEACRTVPRRVQCFHLMAPGEPVKTGPVLQCRISPHQRTGFGAIEIGNAEIVFCNDERFPENPSRHQPAGNIRSLRDGRLLQVPLGK